MATNIFISHSIHNAPPNSPQCRFAHILFETLERNGFNVFFDTHDIGPGNNIPEEVKHNLHKAHGAVIILSDEVKDSYWVQNEFTILSNKPSIHGTIICPVAFPTVDLAGGTILFTKDSDFTKLRAIDLTKSCEEYGGKNPEIEFKNDVLQSVANLLVSRFESAKFIGMDISILETIHNHLMKVIKEKREDFYVLEWLNKITGFHVGTNSPDSRRSLLAQYFLDQVIFSDLHILETVQDFFKKCSLCEPKYFKIIGSSWSSIDSSAQANKSIFDNNSPSKPLAFPKVNNWKFFLELFLWRAIAIKEDVCLQCVLSIIDFSDLKYVDVDPVLQELKTKTDDKDNHYTLLCLNGLLMNKLYTSIAHYKRIVPVYIYDAEDSIGDLTCFSAETENVLKKLSVDDKLEKIAAEFKYSARHTTSIYALP